MSDTLKKSTDKKNIHHNDSDQQEEAPSLPPSNFNKPTYLPRTMMLECNRGTSDLKSDSDYTTWQCAFNNVNLREGDQISVHSSYLHSRGVGDLISFNHSGDDQDDQARMVMSYYVCNDALNQKREGYNIDDVGKEYKDFDNKPSQLYRFAPTSEWGTPSNAINAETCDEINSTEDSFLPGLFRNSFKVFGDGISTTFDPNNKQISLGLSNDEKTLYFQNRNQSFDLWARLRLFQVVYIKMEATQYYPPGTDVSVDGFHQIIEIDPTWDGGKGRFGVNIENAFIPDVPTIVNWLKTPNQMWGANLTIYFVPSTDYGDEANYGSDLFFWNFNKASEFPLNTNQTYYSYNITDNWDPTHPELPVGYDNTTITGPWGECILKSRPPDPFTYDYKGTLKNLIPSAGVGEIELNETGALPLQNEPLLCQFNNSSGEYCLAWDKGGGVVTVNRCAPAYTWFGGNIPSAHAAGTEVFFYTITDKLQNLQLTFELVDDGVLAMKEDYQTLANKINFSYLSPLDSISDFTTPNAPLCNNLVAMIRGKRPTTFLNNFTPHYRYKDFAITDINYASPSDVGTELTKQTHTITNALDKDGNEIPGTELSGISQNEFIFPIFTPATETDASGNIYNFTEPTDKLLEWWDIEDGTRIYGGLESMRYMPTGSFCAIHKTYQIPDVADDVNWFIWFRTQNLYHNLGNMTSASGSGEKSIIYAPYDVLKEKKNEAQTLTAATKIGFPLRYIENKEAYVSQLCGSDNVSIDFDESLSKFNISYLHQPNVSAFVDNNGSVSGGTPSAIIYFPTVTSSGGYPYKVNKTRAGGVNIENWYAKKITKGQYTRSTIGSFGPLDLTYQDPIAVRFWEKLGFTTTFTATKVGWITNSTTKQQEPNGTTDALIDVSTSLITQVEPPENEPRYFDVNLFDPSNPKQGVMAGYQYSSVGGMYLDSVSRGYGLPNTQGKPIEYKKVDLDDNMTYVADDGTTVTWLSKGELNRQTTTFNPDRERNTAFTVDANSNQMLAPVEPIKVEQAYFYILSDIIDEVEGHITYKQLEMPIVSIASKLDTAQDYYFSNSSPMTFYIRRPRMISTVTISIRDQNLQKPTLISENSSVIFMVQRASENPLSIIPTILQQQQLYFEMMMRVVQELLKSQNKSNEMPSESNLLTAYYDYLFDQPNDIQDQQLVATALQVLNPTPVNQPNVQQPLQQSVTPQLVKKTSRTQVTHESFLPKLKKELANLLGRGNKEEEKRRINQFLQVDADPELFNFIHRWVLGGDIKKGDEQLEKFVEEKGKEALERLKKRQEEAHKKDQGLDSDED